MHSLYHSKAEKYLEDLTKELQEKLTQEKLDELYEKIDKFQTHLADNPIFLSGLRNQFALCASEQISDSSDNKKISTLQFLCFVEETYDTIINLFSDNPIFCTKKLKDYGEGLAHAYHFLDEEGQKLIGDLYPGYLGDVL